MPLVTVDSVILQTIAYGETSKILRLLTSEHGVRSAIARGALRPRSRFGGVLEPFSEGTATLYLKEGRELQTLSGFELTKSRQALGDDLLRFGGASLIAEIVLRTASEESHPGLHAGLRSGLERVQSAGKDVLEAVILSEAWQLIARLGFAPALEECVDCGRRLEPEESASFDYGSGGVRCDDCAIGAAGRPMPPHARADLVRLHRGDPPQLGRTEAHWQLLGRYLAQHVLEGTPLRSLAFLAESLVSRPCVD